MTTPVPVLPPDARAEWEELARLLAAKRAADQQVATLQDPWCRCKEGPCVHTLAQRAYRLLHEYLTGERIARLLAAAQRGMEAEAKAAMWDVIRPALSVDGDYAGQDGEGPHYQFVIVDEEQLHTRTCHAGWTHTVESLAARAASPITETPANAD